MSFESLNYKREELNQSDLVELLMVRVSSHAPSRKRVNDAWDRLDGNLKPTTSFVKSTDFLQLVHESTWGALKQPSDLVGAYRELLDVGLKKDSGKGHRRYTTCVEVAEHLASQSDLLRKLLNPPAATWDEKAIQLTILLKSHLANKFAFAMAMPLLEFGEPLKSDPKSTERYVRGIRLIHSFVFRYYVLGQMKLGAYTRRAGGIARSSGSQMPSQ